MVERITCPGCQQALPPPANRHVPWLTCPRCLSRVANPEVPAAEGIRLQPNAPPPLSLSAELTGQDSRGEDHCRRQVLANRELPERWAKADLRAGRTMADLNEPPTGCALGCVNGFLGALAGLGCGVAYGFLTQPRGLPLFLFLVLVVPGVMAGCALASGVVGRVAEVHAASREWPVKSRAALWAFLGALVGLGGALVFSLLGLPEWRSYAGILEGTALIFVLAGAVAGVVGGTKKAAAQDPAREGRDS
jgi:hypothetical protein